jgi:hypothetical protein
MRDEDIIPATEFCVHHNIELSFIQSLKELGMIETVMVEESIFLPLSQLGRLEKIVRLHFELDINLEGIETITHLLKRIEDMQGHINRLTNRLKAYED